MTAVLFSVPVHESNDTILATIANSRRFNGLQHSYMLHVDANWQGFDPSITSLHNVYVNPQRWPTQHAHSQIATHMTNFIAAIDLGLDFQYIAILHTSEMFVRRGMHDHIVGTDHALWFTPDTQPHGMQAWPPMDFAQQLSLFKDLFPANDRQGYLGNILEGSWWSRELFAEMLSWTLRHYDLGQLQLPWAAEECFFPTLAWHLSGQGGNHRHPYCAFHHADHFLPDTALVDGIRAGQDVTFWQPHNFVYDYRPFPSQGLFSVKRLPRDLADPVRQYIACLAD